MCYTLSKDLKNIHTLGADYLIKSTLSISNPFWIDIYLSYYSFKASILPINPEEAKRDQLFYNNNIKVGGKSIYRKKFIEKGIYNINDILKKDGSFLKYEEFIQIYGHITNYLDYASIVSSVKSYLNKIKITDIGEKIAEPFVPFSISILLKSAKGCKNIYDRIISKNVQPSALQKWSYELGENQSNIIKLFKLPFICQKNTFLQWFQTRINHRILGTNHLLNRMNILDSAKCSLCQLNDETIIHLFCDCPIVKTFWQELISLLNLFCPMLNLHLSKNDIIFGNKYLDNVVNKTLILAKYYIFKTKETSQDLNVETYKRCLLKEYKTDEQIARENMKVKEFERYWKPLSNLISYITG